MVDLSPNSVLKNAEKGGLEKKSVVEDEKKKKMTTTTEKCENGFIPCPGGQIVVENDRVARPRFKQGKHFYKHNQVSKK